MGIKSRNKPRRKLVVDLFAGGGGASEGIQMGLGRSVDIAVNHDAVAIAMHKANHPETKHYLSDVFEVDPKKATRGRPVGLLWASPDCKHFSKAKGGKPRSQKIRALAWVVVNWAEAVKPDVIILENVEEFVTWGPLLKSGKPCKRRKGQTFAEWKGRLEGLGYTVDHRELRACDYGTPTIRKRFFLVARCDGKPIRWPAPSHAGPASLQVQAGKMPAYRPAAECIDWSIKGKSIFGRKKPLADATMRRIAKGVQRYVIDAADPFIVPMTHHGDSRVHGIHDPLRTVTTANRGELALGVPVLAGVGGRAGQTAPRSVQDPYVTTTTKADMGLGMATLISTAHGEVSPGGVKRWSDGTKDIKAPLGTITASNDFAVTAATLVQSGYGERPGQAPRALDLEKPLGTVVATGKHAVVEAHLMLQNNDGFNLKPGRGMGEPVSTVTASGSQQSLVTAVMSPFYGSSETGGEGNLNKPAKAVTAGGQHHGLVTAHLETITTGHAASSADEPVPTVTTGGQQAVVECQLSPEATEGALRVAAFFMKYYGTGGQWQACNDPMHTISTKDRLALVTVVIKGTPYVIVDITLRMLTPRELFTAQGFRKEYNIAPLIWVKLRKTKKRPRGGWAEKPITKTAQVKCCGNSVPPQFAEALSRANCRDDYFEQRMAA